MKMSTNVTPLEKPAYLNSVDAGDDAASLAASSTSVPRISLKGRKYRMIEGGEEVHKADTLKVIILGIEPEGSKFIKAYYDGPYNPQDTAPPDCASSTGLYPDGWVQQPQSDRCMTCPKNQFGSATSMSGKKAKACKDSKRAWVQVLPIEGVNHDPETIYAMGIPVTSLRSAAEYGRTVKAQGVPLAVCITELSMEDSEFPQIAFQLTGFLDESAGLKAIDVSNKKSWQVVESPREDQPKLAKPDYLKAVEDKSESTPAETVEPAAKAPTAASVDSVVDSW